ncbi:MAG: response regulator [Bacteroidales bacterium]
MIKKKILVIEDEPSLREEISEILEFEGFDVISADNGKSGIALAFEQQPMLILSDIMMPEMDGIEVLRCLRGNELTKLTPFIFMTALSERENIRLGMELGADDYVTKPFTRNDLLKALETRIQKLDSISDEKEQALETLRRTIITRLPHELRSPLSGIIGFGTLLKDMAENLSTEEVADIGKEILHSGNRLLRLIENYMIYVQLQLSDVKKEIMIGEHLNPTVEESALTVAQKYNRENQLKINLEKVDSLNIAETFLNKIIFELSDNAFRFSPQDSEIIIEGKSIDDQKYTISITDKGRGFTKEQLNNIGAYMQFDRDKLEQQGSGLGLIIAKKMVELSEGDFIIESEKDQGTTIQLILEKGK